MARASYQKIDNIRIGGTKPVSVKLTKKNKKTVTVCLKSVPTHKEIVRNNNNNRDILRLKIV